MWYIQLKTQTSKDQKEERERQAKRTYDSVKEGEHSAFSNPAGYDFDLRPLRSWMEMSMRSLQMKFRSANQPSDQAKSCLPSRWRLH